MKYFSNWSNHEEMVLSFRDYGPGYTKLEVPANMATEEQVLFASYADGDYSGEAHVLFERDGKLWEVEGSHCSCNGLEGQWHPGEVTWEALALRLPVLGTSYDHTPEALAALETLIRQHVPAQAAA